MTESAAKLFSKNRDEMTMPVAPADQTNLGLQTQSLSSSFKSAANNDNIQNDIAPSMNTADKIQLAEGANLAGETLTQSYQGVKFSPPPGNGAGYMAGQVGKMGMELGKELLGLFGPKPGEEKPDFDSEHNMAMPKPFMGFRPGSGMSVG